MIGRDETDAPRDAHLLAALRHAPDRDAQPPREVSERILAAARAAVHPARAPWWQRATAWLAQPRLAASFGTLVAALLVGVMWSTREPPPAAQGGSPSSLPAERDGRSAAPAPSSAESVARDDAVVAEPSVAQERATGESERSREVALSKVQPVPPRAAAAAPAQKARSAPKADAAAPPAMQAEAPPPAERRSPIVSSTPSVPAPSADTTVKAAGAATPARREEVAEDGRSGRPVELSRNAQQQPAIDPLGALEITGTAAWTWQVAGLAGERDHAAPQQALWAAWQAATRGRWERVATQSSPPVPWVQLSLQGRPRAVFWLADGALYLADAQGATWRAPVTPQQQREWQQALAGW